MMDGWQNIKDFDSFVRLFGALSRTPWLHAIRNPLILEDWLAGAGAVKSWQAMRRLWSAAPSVHAVLPDTRCDILIYCSSDKPSVQPALSWLAERLGMLGVTTLLWRPKALVSYPCPLQNPGQVVADIRAVIERGLRPSALIDIPACILRTVQVYIMACVTREPVAVRLVARPRRLFAEIVLARHRVRIMAMLLRRLKPRFVLTNGEQTPIGLALTAAAGLAGVRVVSFFNEWPTSQMLPLVCDEIWVWNAAVKKTLESIQPSGTSMPKIEVIGLAQLDCIDEQIRRGEIKPAQLSGDKCLLFLSEHIPSYAHHNSEATEKALAWLATAAKRAPDWQFVIKPRPYHTSVLLPGEHNLVGLNNIFVLRDGSSIDELLASPQIRACAALSSSGLILAAATGRVALRLAVTGDPYPLPPLDAVVRRVDSADALVAALDEPAPMLGDDTLPNRGRVLDCMQALCLQHAKTDSTMAEA